jgi:geranylgeranyl pyrophosphate synthase
MSPAALDRWTPLVERALDSVLPPADRDPPVLHEAMRYSVMAGGKRLRPVLAMAAYEACGGSDPEAVLPAAAALELFHTYSLIHDDLPAMDDDTLRRGKPTCHVVFGEAVAILAGDALQTLGAYLLATRPEGPRWASRRAKASRIVLHALGSEGMAGGQVLDLQQTGSGAAADRDLLLRIHTLKTGRLLEASLLAGASWAGAPAKVRRALLRYGASLGLAFQVVDDILDLTGGPEAIGKTPGKDSRQGKVTFPAVWGLEESRKEAERLLSEALRSVSALGAGARELRELAHFVVARGA